MDKRVLFIEDEPFTVEPLATMLRERGYTVELIVDLTEAARLLSSQRYSLLILDIMLPHNGIIEQSTSPKKSGIAFAKMLRVGGTKDHNMGINADLPVVVLTAVMDPSSISEIRELKPAGLLRKPVAWTEFFQAVEAAVGSALGDQ